MNLFEIESRFNRDGFVKLDAVLSSDELDLLRSETAQLIDAGWQGKEPPQHYFHAADSKTGEEVFHRVQFLFPKSGRQPNPYLALLGHPKLLAVAAKLFEGFHFGLSGEALVFKTPRNGRPVPLHCDGMEWSPDLKPHEIFFNIGVYLDDSTPENGCLLAAPGSHLHPASELIRQKGFEFPGLQEIPAKAGDVIIHNTRLVHGSHASRSPALRRTLYYEFRTLEWMVSPEHALAMGVDPHALKLWIEARARLLQHAIGVRKACTFAHTEPHFNYVVPEWLERSTSPVGALNLAPSFGGAYF